MADAAVIAIARARLSSFSEAPLMDPLNKRNATYPVPYTSIEEDDVSIERISIGPSPYSQFRETGTITIAVNVASGEGSDAGRAIVENARALFHNYALGHFNVTVVGSPIPVSPDEGNWFQLKFPVQYRFDFFK